MELRSRGEGTRRQPPAPDTPLVTVLFGGDEGGPDLGLVAVEVPPGASMPEHDHGGSDVVLIGVEGEVAIRGGGDTIAVGAGDTALVRKHERVSLRNIGPGTARLLVAAAPANFVAAIRSWPEPATTAAR